MAYPTDPDIAEAFVRNMMEMIKEDMDRNDLAMYDAFMIWSLGRSRWKDTTLSKIRKEKDGSTTDDGDAEAG